MQRRLHFYLPLSGDFPKMIQRLFCLTNENWLLVWSFPSNTGPPFQIFKTYTVVSNCCTTMFPLFLIENYDTANAKMTAARGQLRTASNLQHYLMHHQAIHTSCVPHHRLMSVHCMVESDHSYLQWLLLQLEYLSS